MTDTWRDPLELGSKVPTIMSKLTESQLDISNVPTNPPVKDVFCSKTTLDENLSVTMVPEIVATIVPRSTTATGESIVPIVPTSERTAPEPPIDKSFHFSLFTWSKRF
jgi:hypothetical protein